MGLLSKTAVLAGCAAALCALPAAANASMPPASFDKDFTLTAGQTHRYFALHLTAPGTIGAVLRYSDITNPHGRFQVTLRKAGSMKTVTLIATPSGLPKCQGAAGSIYCSGHMLHATPGTYYLTVWKYSKAAARIELRATWPAEGCDARPARAA